MCSTPANPLSPQKRRYALRVRPPTNTKATFLSIGGLSHHIKLLREIIILPLLYGDLYHHFNIKPPRGVIFYGPPGTGKTLLAAALASEINKEAGGKVSFYQRKGADILDKWVGESERKLRELFDKARKTRPSIIFFDELDGLAPERSNRNDQVHSSVVATLLAMMDGLDDSSGVVVIGATNRIESVDPALRRPGRFDRELYFPLPNTQARKEIFLVHTASWKHAPSNELINHLAESTSGCCGSDLQAICAEAVLCCLKRKYPDISNQAKVDIDLDSLKLHSHFVYNSSIFIEMDNPTNDEREQFFTPLFFGKKCMSLWRVLHNDIVPIVKREIKDDEEEDLKNAVDCCIPSHRVKVTKGVCKNNKYDKVMPWCNTNRKRNVKRLRSRPPVWRQDKMEGVYSTAIRELVQVQGRNGNNHKVELKPPSSRLADGSKIKVEKGSIASTISKAKSLRKNSNDETKIHKLWKHVTNNTTRDLPVVQLELLYDALLACIFINTNNFPAAIKGLQNTLTSFENVS